MKYMFLLWLTVIIYRVFYCWFPKVFSACWGSNRLVPPSKLVPPIIDGDRDVRTGKLELVDQFIATPIVRNYLGYSKTNTPYYGRPVVLD